MFGWFYHVQFFEVIGKTHRLIQAQIDDHKKSETFDELMIRFKVNDCEEKNKNGIMNELFLIFCRTNFGCTISW